MRAIPTMEHFVVTQIDANAWRASYVEPVTNSRTFAEAYRAGEMKEEFRPIGFGATKMQAIHQLVSELCRLEARK